MRLVIFLTFMSYLSLSALTFDLQGKTLLSRHSYLEAPRKGAQIRSLTDTLPLLNQTILRQKKDSLYFLYAGEIKQANRNQWVAYQANDLHAWDLIRQGRFFQQYPHDSVPEIREVIWDHGILITPAFHDTLWVQMPQGIVVLLASPLRPVSLSLTCDQVQAQVWIDQDPPRPCPLQTRLLTHGVIHIQAHTSSSQIFDEIFLADWNQHNSIQIPLSPMPRFQRGDLVEPATYSAHGTQDLHALEEKMGVSQLMETQYEQQEAREMALLNWQDTLRNRLYTEYIPPKYLAFAEYDSLRKGLSVRLWYGLHDFDFGFDGIIPCSPSEALLLQQQLNPTRRSSSLKQSQRRRRLGWPGEHTSSSLDGILKLQYRNWKATVRNQSRQVQRFYALESLQLILPDQVISLEGDFLPAGYIRNSEEWEEFIRTAP